MQPFTCKMKAENKLHSDASSKRMILVSGLSSSIHVNGVLEFLVCIAVGGEGDNNWHK